MRNPFKIEPILYRKCNELPIHNFNEASTNGDLSYLKKNRKDVVKDSVLQSVWLDILDEFLSISKNSLVLSVLQKKAKTLEMNKLLGVYIAIDYCLELKIDVSEQCKAYKVKPQDIKTHIAMIRNDINRVVDQIPSDEKEKDPMDFDRSIMILNQNGFSINRHITVVTEWVTALTILEQQQKAKTDAARA